MTALAPHRDAPIRRRDRAPWSPRAWSQVLYLTGGIPALAVVPLLMVAGGLATKPRWALPLLVLVVAFLVMPLLTSIHRHRLRATAGVVIEPQPVMPNGLTVAGIREAIRSPVTWRQAGYHFLAAPALAVAAATAFAMWLAGVLYALVYAYAWTLPGWALLARGQSEGPSGHLAPISNIPIDVYLTVGGLVLLTAAPWLTAGVAALDVRITQAALGRSRAEELEHRVERLTETRAGVVDAADAERRRLERNLHDGTQQRLVSLAMNLGMAKAQTETVEEAHEAIAEAHEEAKAALAELRNLIRGLHPPVLENRGLDAALSGVAARMPIPVRLTVNVPRRPPPTIEAVAYFVVSEGLTNITKHSQASQAEVFVQRDGDRLHIIVTDDGVGGADPARGTGLAGLARRAESVDGTLELASPPGGPTLLTVDLPCAR
ncbi:MAG TPA: histidine kinase [Streptosporangiaceae bacterium]|nr:histidine kinase [Streptosporangiaceae bacterium]